MTATTTAKQPTAATPSTHYLACAEKWQMIDDLCGGTRAMRAAGTRWLPMEPKEEVIQYDARKGRSILYGALNETIDNTVSKPFSQPLTLSEAPLPEKLEKIENNADRNGQNLTSFGAEAFKAAVKYGLTHAIVDNPSMMVDEDGNAVRRTLKDERDEDIRPYFVHVPPTALIGYRTQTLANGDEIVTMARIKSEEIVEDGPYGDKKIYRVVVWTVDTVETWEADKDDEDEYRMVHSVSHTYGEVPLHTLYIERTGTMEANIPFEDLAWLNIAHWQSFSDQRNILRVARVPIVVAAGFTENEVGKNMTISTARFIRTKNPDSKLYHVEHSGKAIEAGEKDLERLEERMVILGLQPLIQRSGNQTATGKAIDTAQSHTAIQAWIRECENFIRMLYESAAKWIGEDLHDDFKVSINNDFGFALNAVQDVKNLIDMRKQNEITPKTFMHELKRRGVLSDGVNIDKELAELEELTPKPDMGDFPNDEPDPEADPEKESAKDKGEVDASAISE